MLKHLKVSLCYLVLRSIIASVFPKQVHIFKCLTVFSVQVHCLATSSFQKKQVTLLGEKEACRLHENTIRKLQRQVSRSGKNKQGNQKNL